MAHPEVENIPSLLVQQTHKTLIFEFALSGLSGLRVSLPFPPFLDAHPARTEPRAQNLEKTTPGPLAAALEDGIQLAEATPGSSVSRIFSYFFNIIPFSLRSRTPRCSLKVQTFHSGASQS